MGTEIIWKEVDPTKKKVKKKQKHKKTGEIRTMEHVLETESFFNIFSSRKLADANDMDSDDEATLRDRLDEVQQIVEDFHDLLVPDCLEHYLGLNQDFDMMGLGEDSEEEEKDDNNVDQEQADIDNAG